MHSTSASSSGSCHIDQVMAHNHSTITAVSTSSSTTVNVEHLVQDAVDVRARHELLVQLDSGAGLPTLRLP